MSWALGLRTKYNSKSSAAIALIVLALILCFISPNVQAQTSINFTTADKFSIPATNGIISFGVNGSYSTAALQGNVWTFTDLHLNRSQQIAVLKISVENSNMTITSYSTRNATSYQIPNESLRYRIVGEGKVTVNLGTSNANKSSGSDWYVTKAGRNSTIFFAVGKDYSLGSDGTLTINSITGTVTVTHNFNYLGNTANLPFYLQHSVIITVALVVVLAFTIVVVVRLKNKPAMDEQAQNGGDT
jgi:hypothetical protein